MNNKLKAIAEELFPTRMHFYSEISAVKSLLYKTAYRRVKHRKPTNGKVRIICKDGQEICDEKEL